jgi:hypothetical protein
MADINEYTIDGDDLEQLLAEIAEGGYTSTPAYKLTVRIYPAARKVSFNVNDGGYMMPVGELTHTIHA